MSTKKITIYGAGYVGLVTAVCLAEYGHSVCCIDIDPNKIDLLKNGHTPIYEEGLESLLQKNLENKHIIFSNDIHFGTQYSELQMIAVGTPQAGDGAADLRFVESVARNIGQYANDYVCVINKSTAPVGTTKKVSTIIKAELQKRQINIEFDVVSNPEFLREGRAITDCLQPDRIIVGTNSEKATELMQKLYEPYTEKKHSLLFMDCESAELTKYAANAFLATKISFINEISQIAEATGANIDHIKKGIGLDSRINPAFLNAGCGFGGSCFPKDLRALRHLAKLNHYEPHLLNSVLQVNQQQQELLFYKIKNHFNNQLTGKVISLWGLAFKPNTDDIRCASSRVLIKMLSNAGAKIQAYDPLAMDNIRKLYQQDSNITLCKNPHDTLNNTNALVIVTEWDEFKQLDLSLLKKSTKMRIIFDGRNIYDQKIAHELGFEYYGIGRARQKIKQEELV